MGLLREYPNPRRAAVAAHPRSARALLARDSYSYLHLPLVGGIVCFALGVNEAIARPGQPLTPLTALALCGGVGLFFAGDVAYRWRDHHQLAVDRLVAAAAAVVVISLAVPGPSLGALLALTAVCALRSGWEIWHPPSVGPAAA